MRLGDLDALKEEFAEYGETAKFTQGACQRLIENAPTVDLTKNQAYDKGFITAMKLYSRPQGKWIPVSERLPEFMGLYLISVDDVVTVANFTGTYFMHRGGGRVKVYAWQPLPEPYKEGDAE